jgi:multidrug efflux pump subunit AcrB
MEWRLEYNSDQLSRLGITIADIRQAIYRYYQKSFLGTYDTETLPGNKQWNGWL